MRVDVASGNTREVIEQDLKTLAPPMQCAEPATNAGELLERALELKGGLRNTVTVLGRKLVREGPKQVGAKCRNIAVGVQHVRVGVHGNEVGVIGLEGPNEGVLEDRLVQNLLGHAGGGGSRVKRRSATEGVVELQRPARLAVFVRPQPRLEGLEELEPGGFLIALVVSTTGACSDFPSISKKKGFLQKRMRVYGLLTSAAGTAGFAGGPWDEAVGFARSPHERLRVLYAGPFGRLTT